jgi:short-subunit dehydrogenase
MLDTRPEDWRWTVDVNLMGVAYGVTTFGPLILQSGEGHIVNTASEAGLVTNAVLGMYCATKHAVVGLSESLYRELEDTPVGVSVLCPNLVKTSIFHSERNRSDGVQMSPAQQAAIAPLRESMNVGLSPAKVAHTVVDAIRANRFWVFTHPETRGYAARRFEDIEAERNPTPAYPQRF